jgi:hypothetical protein
MGQPQELGPIFVATYTPCLVPPHAPPQTTTSATNIPHPASLVHIFIIAYPICASMPKSITANYPPPPQAARSRPKKAYSIPFCSSNIILSHRQACCQNFIWRILLLRRGHAKIIIIFSSSINIINALH